MNLFRLAGCVLSLGLLACSPSLNWRTVSVVQLAALLPCKPDHAERLVDMADGQRMLSVWGCEADGALFAVSHLHIDSPVHAEDVVAAWQLAALRNIPGAVSQPLPFAPTTPAGQAAPPTGVMLRATGTGPDGQALQAQLAWFQRGADVYHLAVFSRKLTVPMTETFFTEWHWL